MTCTHSCFGNQLTDGAVFNFKCEGVEGNLKERQYSYVVMQLEFTAASLKEGILFVFFGRDLTALYSLLINLLFSGYQVARFLFDNYALKLLKFESCYDASFDKLYISAIYT